MSSQFGNRESWNVVVYCNWVEKMQVEIDVKADNEDDAYDKGYEEVENELDVSSIYDELYEEMNNACIYLDGEYDCDFTEYVEVREIKEKK